MQNFNVSLLYFMPVIYLYYSNGQNFSCFASVLIFSCLRYILSHLSFLFLSSDDNEYFGHVSLEITCVFKTEAEGFTFLFLFL
jgi:hypothetical protein